MIKNQILISVCIATYKREELLKNLLQSLLLQELPTFSTMEIILVDNDSFASAKRIFQQFNNTEKIQFKYLIQPEKNISLTRNMSVKNASGEYLCFIDDDETADENWIMNLLKCILDFRVDGAFGYVEPVFNENIPDYFKHREFYFSSVGTSGSKARYYYTTNCMIKSELIKTENIPFNPSYGLTGGEDVHLFERLAKKGAKFVYCKEAVTYEFIPRNRANFKYLFNRALRGGQSYLRRRLENKSHLLFKVSIILKVILRIISGLIFLALYPFSKNKSILGIISIGDAIGKSRALLSKFKELY